MDSPLYKRQFVQQYQAKDYYHLQDSLMSNDAWPPLGVLGVMSIVHSVQENNCYWCIAQKNDSNFLYI